MRSHDMQRQDLMDKALLFACCAALSLTQPLGIWHIAPILASAIAVGVCSYFERPKFRLATGAVYLVVCIFYQPLCAFLPVMIYSVYEREHKGLTLVALVPLMLAGGLAGPLRFMVVVLAAVALVLKHRAASLAELSEQYLSLLDTTRAMSREIQSQNKLLLERQNDEIMLARLGERTRIARDIHDHVGHRISSAILQIGAMLTAGPEPRALNALKETLNLAMDDIRVSVHGIYESSIDLVAQMEHLAASLTCCRVEQTIYLETDPGLQVKHAFISAVKEAFANVAKHSDATLVRLTITEHKSFYQLVVSDNGNAPSTNYASGLGLKSIAERIEALRGQFLIKTRNGFEIFITVPKGAADETSPRR